MAQSDYVIDGTVTPAQLRAELNQILQSVATNNSGPEEPSPTYPLMLWGDTLAGLLKIRNTSNTAWIVVGTLDKIGLDIHLLRRLLFRLAAPFTGSDSTTAQSIFGVGVSLEASTNYEFEILVRLQKTAGTTSHNLSLAFGGTASLQGLAYVLAADTGGVGTIPATNGWIAASSAAVVTSIASAAVGVTLRARGTISVATAGTLVPQYQLSAAPGGPYAVQAGSFMSLVPLGSSAGNLNLGGWT